MQSPPLVVAAQAPWPPGVQACMSQRQGGVSASPFDGFNLGDHVGDDPACVQVNRQLWVQSTAPSPVFLKQVHGVGVAALQASSAQASSPIEADACWTQQPGVVCTMMVADCLPILLAAADGSSVAAVHAGDMTAVRALIAPDVERSDFVGCSAEMDNQTCLAHYIETTIVQPKAQLTKVRLQLSGETVTADLEVRSQLYTQAGAERIVGRDIVRVRNGLIYAFRFVPDFSDGPTATFFGTLGIGPRATKTPLK